jgi:hypothetical protein
MRDGTAERCQTSKDRDPGPITSHFHYHCFHCIIFRDVGYGTFEYFQSQIRHFVTVDEIHSLIIQRFEAHNYVFTQ